MEEQGKFRKKLNLLDLTFLGCGCIIGSGWLLSALTAAQFAGPSAWISWLIGGIMFLFIGLVYAELGAALPRTGGLLRYPEFSHGSMVGYLVAFASILGGSATVGVEVVAVRQYATFYIPELSVGSTDTPTLLGFLVEAAIVVIFFLVNYWSVNFFGKANTVWTAFKFIVPILTVVFFAFSMEPSNFSEHGADPGGIHGIFEAVTGAGIAFAFLGLRQALDFGGEAKNPQRDVPWAIILALGGSLALYIALQIVFIGAVPGSSLGNGGWAAIDWSSPWAKLASVTGVIWLQNVILVDAVVSPAGTGNVFFSGMARAMYAWAKNGYFYSVFLKVDKRTGLPRGALWLMLILGILWTLPQQFQTWTGLVSAVSASAGLTYMIGAISVLSFRKSRPNLERPFKLKGINIIAPLAFVSCGLVAYWSGWEDLIIFIPVTIGSLLLYFAFADKDKFLRAHLREDVMSGLWLFGYYIFLLVLSYLGSFGPGKVIPGPWDTVICGVGSIFIYYWGLVSALKTPRITYDEEEDISPDSKAQLENENPNNAF